MVDEIEAMLSRFRSKSGLSRGLPASAYTDESFWRIECDTVLAQTWVCAGFAHELAEPGDAVPATIAGKPVLLVKNAKCEIVGFHNVCRHRCLQLVEKSKNVGKLIRCPYHAWAL